MASDPIGQFISSGVTPNASVDVNRDIVSGSSNGISVAIIPVKSSNILIMVGASCPSISSFSIRPLIEW
ncbi:hypothetical protein SDC9_124014 [bioreactor metagenome]|uniref:Uncharacterized protein n=1 Tax=bioreactor metagenome TaxID=1076179 RepID=A0A645CJ93_9ZZZZ